MRSYSETWTLQTRTSADDGLQEVWTWADSTTHRVTKVEAAKRDLERAGLALNSQAFTIIGPKGLTVDPAENRWQDASNNTYLIRRVHSTPVNVIMTVERTS